MSNKYIYNKKTFLTIEETALKLLVSNLTVKRWIKSGKLKAIKINKRGDWRIKESDLEKYLREMNS